MEAEAGYARDLEVLRSVRAAHPSARLFVDMNDGYSVDRTLRFLEDTAELDLFWIEEPVAEEQAGLTRFRDRRRELGLQASPHAWGHPLKTLYAAQLAAATDVVPVVEGAPGTIDGVDDAGYTLREGEILLPRSPGLALELAVEHRGSGR